MAQKALQLNKVRNLGDIISDSFIFVKRNYKVIGELFVILVLPILLVGIYNLYFVFQGIDFLNPSPQDPFGAFEGVKIFLGYGLSMIGILVFYYINYSTAICYVDNENETPTRSMVVNFMKDNAVKYILYFFTVLIVMIALVALLIGSAMVHPAITVIFFLALMVSMVFLFPYLSIFPLIYMDKDLSFSTAISETRRMISGQWWPTFGTIIITNIIGSFASYILIIPVYAVLMIQMFSTTDGGESGMGFWMSILMIVSIISSTIILTYTTSAVAMKYFDLLERKDRSSLKDRIDSIGTTDSSIFENEGDF